MQSASPSSGNDIAIGSSSLQSDIGPGFNVAIGPVAMNNSSPTGGLDNDEYYQNGAFDVAIGFRALLSDQGHGYNTAIGGGALDTVLTGSNNVAIGYKSGFNVPLTIQNSISIGAYASALADNCVVFPMGIRMGINTSLPTANLHVEGNVYASNSLTTTNVSATTANVATLNVTSLVAVSYLTTGNIYASNALTTTNVYAAGFTSNVDETQFNYSTLDLSRVTINGYSGTDGYVLMNYNNQLIWGDPGLSPWIPDKNGGFYLFDIGLFTDSDAYYRINAQGPAKFFGSPFVPAYGVVILNNYNGTEYNAWNLFKSINFSQDRPTVLITDIDRDDYTPFYSMTELHRLENDGKGVFHLSCINNTYYNTPHSVGFGFYDNARGYLNDPPPFIIAPCITPTLTSDISAPSISISSNTNAFGYVGIGTFEPQYQLDVAGNINIRGDVHLLKNGVVKAFNIEHPVLENERLVHSCIEGPRIDLIYRGTVKLVDGTARVNIDSDSTTYPMTQGTFVGLCINAQYFLQNSDSFDRVIGKLDGNILKITCENKSSTDVISWMVIAERCDAALIPSSYTDSKGILIPEYTRHAA
jgi:hypothetical protein